MAECERKLDRLQFAVSQITSAILQSYSITRRTFVSLMKVAGVNEVLRD